MPRRIPELAGGVLTTPCFTRKMFSPGPSATTPAEFSRIASSYPPVTASIFARAEFA